VVATMLDCNMLVWGTDTAKCSYAHSYCTGGFFQHSSEQCTLSRNTLADISVVVS